MIRRLNKFQKKNLIYFIIVACLVLLTCSLIPFIRTPLLDILKHPLNLLTLSKREIRGIIFYHRNFIQNEILKKEIDFLRHKLNSYQEAYLENERLRELLALKKNAPYKVIAARVIGRSPENQSSLIIIGKGKGSGIKVGMVAINYLGLVGRVIETSASTANITLINDPNFAVSGIVKRSRQEGLVCGALGNSLIMKYLPAEADIQASDAIITSGMTELYPKGLLIGTVAEIIQEFSGLASYAIIKPAVELSNVEEVLIIAP